MNTRQHFYFIPMNELNFNQFGIIQVATNCNTCFEQLIPVQTSNIINQSGALQNIMAAYLGLLWDFNNIDYHNAMLSILGCVYCENTETAQDFIKNGLIPTL